MLPTIIAHADWGSEARKRCVAEARLDGDVYEIDVPSEVRNPRTLIGSLLRHAEGGAVLLGFDFPIGVPHAYANAAGITDFVEFLRGLGTSPWERFFSVAEAPGEISIHRPFYPMRPGNSKQWHLLGGLGLEKLSSLLRLCERSYEGRGVASPLFWTLGSKQVGKAALSGWREVLQPALTGSGDAVALWPFQGDLADLIKPGVCTIAETYPAEACTHLGLRPPGDDWSKRDQEDRRRHGRKLAQDARSRGVRFTPELHGVIDDGFGPGEAGEDSFDALVGLLAMIEVVRGRRSADVPELSSVRTVEGWILGQDPSCLNQVPSVSRLNWDEEPTKPKRIPKRDRQGPAPRAIAVEDPMKAAKPKSEPRAKQDFDAILDLLDRFHQRATYGAIASVVGGNARFLLKGRPKDPRHSWIVNKETGLPSGYAQDMIHPALMENPAVIASTEKLEAWIDNRADSGSRVR